VTETTDSGLKEGTETASLSGGGNPPEHVSLVLAHNFFFEGNASGLSQFFGFKAAPARAEANQWMEVSRTSALFASFSAELTVASAAEQLYIGGTLSTFPSTTLDGRRVLAVHEVTKELSETVYISASGAPLPVEVVQQVDGLAATTIFGPWDQPPVVKAPVKAVAFKSSWIGKS
jgi:hypothetical protein